MPPLTINYTILPSPLDICRGSSEAEVHLIVFPSPLTHSAVLYWFLFCLGAFSANLSSQSLLFFFFFFFISFPLSFSNRPHLALTSRSARLTHQRSAFYRDRCSFVNAKTQAPVSHVKYFVESSSTQLSRSHQNPAKDVTFCVTEILLGFFRGIY